MKTTMKVEAPLDIVLTMSITMPLSDWNALLKQLDTAWPSSTLAMNIRELVRKTNCHFEVYPPTE